MTPAASELVSLLDGDNWFLYLHGLLDEFVNESDVEGEGMCKFLIDNEKIPKRFPTRAEAQREIEEAEGDPERLADCLDRLRRADRNVPGARLYRWHWTMYCLSDKTTLPERTCRWIDGCRQEDPNSGSESLTELFTLTLAAFRKGFPFSATGFKSLPPQVPAVPRKPSDRPRVLQPHELRTTPPPRPPRPRIPPARPSPPPPRDTQ